MIENVKGILGAVFGDYRNYIEAQFRKLGYRPAWKLFKASDFGVPQLRPRVIFVAIKRNIASEFSWPSVPVAKALSVGETLYDLMAENGWRGAKKWRKQAGGIAPTLVGGSTKHGGPDLGPTRAKRAWAELGVDGHGLVDSAPSPEFEGMPRLTLRMVARLQGFPDDWRFAGKKTNAYRQIGNAFPPPVGCAVARQIIGALETRRVVDLAG